MIGSLMYLTASRPDIMFAVCACARFQVTPKVSHLHAVKRIFRYLKGQPNLGLWYPRDSPFDLEAFSDSDYAGASLDRKSTIGGCQFLRKRLISWQCKKKTIVANSSTEAEYVAAANCCGQVLWIQNQMLDYGFNFMNTKIYIDNESTICIVKNPVFHSKTKHIEIRHHFIRDSYEKRLIQVIKIHIDHNVADLLTKAFDVSSNEFGVKTGSCKVNAARQIVPLDHGADEVLDLEKEKDAQSCVDPQTKAKILLHQDSTYNNNILDDEDATKGYGSEPLIKIQERKLRRKDFIKDSRRLFQTLSDHNYHVNLFQIDLKRQRRKFQETKRKKDHDADKEELSDSMDLVPRMMLLFKADGSSKNYKIFSEMLDDFDKQDVIDLHRLVNERYETTSPEGYDLLLWEI
ncbi:hypothetical protein Tco_0052195 [Tanacetum coccineum]